MPAKKSLRPRSIEEDTGIIPEAVVDGVISEVNKLLHMNVEENIRSDIYGYLTGYAEAVYANNPTFRKKIRSLANGGNAGRDYLYSYMRHWITGELLKACPADERPGIQRLLDSTGFSMGQEIR